MVKYGSFKFNMLFAMVKNGITDFTKILQHLNHLLFNDKSKLHL